jgi:predicted membrane-bound spermidine synthase
MVSYDAQHVRIRRMTLILRLVLFRGNAVRVAASQETANTSDNPDQISITDMQPNVRRAAQAMHAFNQYVVNDPRVEVIILPLFDGLSFIQHRTHSTTSQPAYVHA